MSEGKSFFKIDKMFKDTGWLFR